MIILDVLLKAKTLNKHLTLLQKLKMD